MRRFTALLGGSLLLASSPALALKGDVDSANAHPYVVKISMEREGQQPFMCTGIVRNRAMVVTAAHCVFDADTPTVIRIYYKNARGWVKRTAKKIFIAEAYKPPLKLVALVRRDKKARDAMTPAKRYFMNVLAAQHDVALLLPDAPIALSAYVPSTILDDDLPFAAALDPIRDSEDPWPSDRHDEVVRLLEAYHSRIARDYAVGIGYGSTKCSIEDESNHDLCSGGGERRVARLPMFKTDAIELGKRRALLYSFVYPDKDWTVMPGDSGGPLLARDPHTGKLRLIGIASRGSPTSMVYASLVQSVQLWKKFEADEEYRTMLQKPAKVGVFSSVIKNSGPMRYVRGGLGIADTKREAARLANQECSKDGRPGCKAVRTFGEGFDATCIFVSRGASKRQTFNIGIGVTEEEALVRCRKGGFACTEAFGACTD